MRLYQIVFINQDGDALGDYEVMHPDLHSALTAASVMPEMLTASGVSVDLVVDDV